MIHSKHISGSYSDDNRSRNTATVDNVDGAIESFQDHKNTDCD